MVVRKMFVSGLLLVLVVLLFGCNRGVRPIEELTEVPRVTKETLREWQGDPKTTVIDLRYAPNWKKSDIKIKNAVREEPKELGAWIDRYPKDHRLVLYCD